MGFVRSRRALLAPWLLALGAMALVLGAGLARVAAQSEATVAVVDFAFDPVLTGVAVGDTVTWTNYGAETHTVTADDSTFTSGPLAPGESFSHTFAALASIPYRCRIHPSMTGTVIVNAAAGTGGEMQAVPVVGVGTAAPHPMDAMVQLTAAAAVVFGGAALALRRA